MMWGMRSLLITIGANRMMQSTTKKIIVGLVMGKYCDSKDINFSVLLLLVLYLGAKLLIFYHFRNEKACFFEIFYKISG